MVEVEWGGGGVGGGGGGGGREAGVGAGGGSMKTKLHRPEAKTHFAPRTKRPGK